MKAKIVCLIFYVLIPIAFLAGWIMNIAKIWSAGFDVLSGVMIMRCIGVFLAPLGAILGYL